MLMPSALECVRSLFVVHCVVSSATPHPALSDYINKHVTFRLYINKSGPKQIIYAHSALSFKPKRARRFCDSSSSLFNNTFTSLRDSAALVEDVLLTSDRAEHDELS